ncbi:RecB family exonuclease [Rhodococcus rhodochrous]|uniref:RecB family exonuclease n=1 Tax=Rhodococcus rhodochrous TaxID=1829 RepID=UPI00188A965E|nr:RecB family exonuclease [Rhodococcus rhodochrous]MBF4479493.1 RecB family exonuclease [Rhodococcus rhodochrous]
MVTAAPTPPTDTVRPVALSPSRAADFTRCPLLYRFKAVDRLTAPPTRAQARGTVVHAALEALFALDGPARTPTAAQALLPDALARVLAATPDLGVDTDDAAFLAEAAALLGTYFTVEDPTAVTADGCELRVETTLDGDVPLRGIIDRLDVDAAGAVHVVDYKTGRAPSLRGERAALFQLKFYALILWRQRGIVPASLRLLYLGDGQVLHYRPDPDELDRFARIVRAMWATIRQLRSSGDFRPRPGPGCRWCDHRALCPAFGGTPPPYPLDGVATQSIQSTRSTPSIQSTSGAPHRIEQQENPE